MTEMPNEQWTAEDVQGFTAKVAEFYSSLSPEQQEIFSDMVQDSVAGDEDTGGFGAITGPVDSAMLTDAISRHLLSHVPGA